MTHARVTLDDLAQSVPLARLEGRAVIACDCYVGGIEQHGQAVEWGWTHGVSENIDHHAPVARMARNISSTNLALIRVRSIGVAPPTTEVMINHTDCDSVLSAAIVAGDIPDDDRYGEAAIAADHTGAEHPVADLLQAIQHRRDYAWSLDMLRALDEGRPLHGDAQTLLDGRLRQRDTARDAVATGKFQQLGTIWWAEFADEVDGELLPALLPQAELIVVASPHPDYPERWGIKVRRGEAMAEGRTLDDLALDRFDPAYGGRWNAGSTKRGGGSGVRVENWERGLVERMDLR